MKTAVIAFIRVLILGVSPLMGAIPAAAATARGPGSLCGVGTCGNLRRMSRSAAFALALVIPLTLTGCSQEGSGEANGAVELTVVGGQSNDTLTTTWEPEPDYYGTVRNTENGKSYGLIPVGTYTLTAERSGLSGTTHFEVTEGDTTDVTVTLK